MVTRVSEALARGAIVLQPSYKTFAGTIEGLVGAIVAEGGLSPELSETAVRLIREREAVSSTAMVEISVSVPHTRMDGVEDIVAAIAVSRDDVYQVTAGLPISIVVLVLTPTHLINEHLEFLSGLSMLLQSPRLREQLRSATSADEVLRAIRENERERL